MLDLNTDAEQLHGDEEVVYVDANYPGIAKRLDPSGTAADFRVPMRVGKRLAFPNTPDGRLFD